MSKVTKMRIDISGNAATITLPNGESNSSVKKTVKLDTIIKAFKEQGVKIETPVLPYNCVKYKEKGNGITVGIYCPPAKFTATYSGEEFENCIRPACIMVFEMNSSNGGFTVSRSKIYGVKEEPLYLNDDTKLYILPFPNIGDNGWICWGQNTMAGLFRSLCGLPVFIDRLFKAPFNNDLFQGALFRHVGFDTPRGLFEFLQNKEVWPDELFVETSTRYTLGGI